MKQTLFILLSLSLAGALYAQNQNKSIEVEGKSSQIVYPDSILLVVELKEFSKDDQLVTLSEQEKVIIEKLKEFDLYDSQLFFNLSNASGSEGEVADSILRSEKEGFLKFGKKKNKSMEGKETYYLGSYLLKLKDFSELSIVIELLNTVPLNKIVVVGVSNTALSLLQQQVLKEAALNAQSKAESLLTTLNGSLGSLIQVEEIENRTDFPFETVTISSVSSVPTKGLAIKLLDEKISFKPIEIASTVKVTYSLK
ncbi:MAG: SIMPL domain-containing protein [Cyclobacteriaceae bacterium]